MSDLDDKLIETRKAQLVGQRKEAAEHIIYDKFRTVLHALEIDMSDGIHDYLTRVSRSLLRDLYRNIPGELWDEMAKPELLNAQQAQKQMEALMSVMQKKIAEITGIDDPEMNAQMSGKAIIARTDPE